MKNYITIALTLLGLTGGSGNQVTVPTKPDYDIHPAKVAQARLDWDEYCRKVQASLESEAGFWERNYAESVRAQRSWEQKAFMSDDLSDKL